MGKKPKYKHLLVIRLSAMGDVAMTIPVLISLIQNHPNLSITLLTKNSFAPIFKDLQRVTVVHADVKGEHKGIYGLYRLFSSLKKLKIDAVADLHNVLRSNVLRILFKSVGVPVIQIDKGRNEKKALTRPTNKVMRLLKSSHERYADVFRRLGFAVDLTQDMVLSKPILPQEIASSIDTSSRLIGIAPFATYKSKMYPLDKVELVIRDLLVQTNAQVLLFGGGPKEKELLDTLASKFNNRVVNMTFSVPFKAELDLIANLSVMLAMDSGNGHLAANYGVPVVTLWGVTHPYAGFVPYNQPLSHSILPNLDTFPLLPTSVYGNKFPEGYDKAIETITPDDVVAKITDLL
ncbi:glycosyltransferase family 9 protein [Flavobacterium sp. ASW18X]|uniref:glycosyltransferase family 9 protein n=1 Tax=Flavobacterium sp. ASW18X TaxID=2572595 RepID=UPI0010AE69C2|nr:glycosyltransferase family 9 protein [Flavobacterium sp. ASW18X]TKD65083.1 glycosyltransferase family 9 protein [Flavobacterium sp. ASW18X]